MTDEELEEFKAYINSDADLADVEEELLIAAFNAATTALNDAYTRSFVVASDTPTTQSFELPRLDVLRIPDAAAITAVSIFGSTVDPSQYQPEPLNNRASSGEYRPFDSIRKRGGWGGQGDGWADVVVTARWGWVTLPASFHEARKILGKDVLLNRSIGFGIAELTQFAGVRAIKNPQVAMLMFGLDNTIGVG